MVEAANLIARRHLLDIFNAGVTRVSGHAAVVQQLATRPDYPACAVVAVGKAAAGMMRGAADVLGDRLLAGLLVTKYGHLEPLPAGVAARVECLESAHPVPDENSLLAGRRLFEFVAGQPAERPLLFLVSGGTSALAERLPEGMGLADLQRLSDWLLSSGLDITAMNALRKSFSLLKGGGLATALEGRPAEVWLISDVPGDDPGVVGSGPLWPDPAGAEKIAALKAKLELPDWLRAMLPEDRPQDAVAPPHHVIASLGLALQAATERAAELGYAVFPETGFVEGDAAETGRRLARSLCDAEPGVHLWGGETTVVLPAEPGRGGRNQQLALAAATVIAGRDDLLFLSGGTDGSDGPTGDAGGLVDGGTLQRAEVEGFDAQESLRRADAGSLLEASGDLLNTGPTGTNVMDLMIGLKLPG